MLRLFVSILAFFLGTLGIFLYFRCWGADIFVGKLSRKRLVWGGLLGVALLVIGGVLNLLVFGP